MDDTTRCHAEYSIQKWCRLLGLKQKKLISFLELTEKQLKTKVVYSENIIRIEIPNLLKKRDNYTKHLQVPKKQLVSKDIDKEVDRDIDKKKEKKLVFDFNTVWKRYPNKDGKKAAENHFNATVKTEDNYSDINKALDNYLANLKTETWKKPKNGSTWFNNWQDWINYETPVSQEKDYEIIIDGESQFFTEAEYKEWKAVNGR